jgi:hypothetical protein
MPKEVVITPANTPVASPPATPGVLSEPESTADRITDAPTKRSITTPTINSSCSTAATLKRTNPLGSPISAPPTKRFRTVRSASFQRGPMRAKEIARLIMTIRS